MSTERAILYRGAVDRFVRMSETCDIRNLEISAREWDALVIAADWLKLFRTATTLMSSSKETTLSWVYMVFTCLQDHVRNHLRSLPASVPAELKNGLFRAHAKLTQYFRLIDESPYYLWASSESIHHN